MPMPVTVSALYSYPVKSCAGISHEQSLVSQAGLPFDRHWVIVDQAGVFMTQRTCPRMALIKPVLDPFHLTLNAISIPAISVPLQLPADTPVAVPVRIWQADTTGFDEGNAVAQWLSDFLQTPCRLLRVHPAAARIASPSHVDSWIDKNRNWAAGFPARHEFAFADGFPLLIANQASLDELNRQLGAKKQPPVPMDRFRPNIVLQGLEAYDEDYLLGMRVGALTFAFVKPCARCPIPNIDQSTAQMANEPGLTLAAHRSFKEGVLFGVNAVVTELANAKIQIGDTVQAQFNL